MALSQETKDMIRSTIEQADKSLAENPGVTQVNILLAESGKIYSFFRMSHLDTEQEEICLRQMAKDHARILCLVSKWQYDGVHILDGIDGLEMPMASLRYGLLEIDPANAEAYVPALGENGISVRPLRDYCPPRKPE